MREEISRGNVNAGYIARDRHKNSLIKHNETPVAIALANCFKDLFTRRYDSNYINKEGNLVDTIGINIEDIKNFSARVMQSQGYTIDNYLEQVYKSICWGSRQRVKEGIRIRFYEDDKLLPLTILVSDWYDMCIISHLALRPGVWEDASGPKLPFNGWTKKNPVGYLTDRLKKLKDELPVAYSKSEHILDNLEKAVKVLAERGIKKSEEEIMQLGITGQIATSYIIGLAFSQLGGKERLTEEDKSVGTWFGVK